MMFLPRKRTFDWSSYIRQAFAFAKSEELPLDSVLIKRLQTFADDDVVGLYAGDIRAVIDDMRAHEHRMSKIYFEAYGRPSANAEPLPQKHRSPVAVLILAIAHRIFRGRSER